MPKVTRKRRGRNKRTKEFKDTRADVKTQREIRAKGIYSLLILEEAIRRNSGSNFSFILPE